MVLFIHFYILTFTFYNISHIPLLDSFEEKLIISKRITSQQETASLNVVQTALQF